jgi:ABC-type nitrate/sulfonate/bicarbonate transport system substrate-binding protein
VAPIVIRFAFCFVAAASFYQDRLPTGGFREKSACVADFSERTGLVFVAKDQRFFEERGLEAEVVQVRSGPVAISALAAGDVQFYSAPASGATVGAVTGGLDLVFIAGIINKLDGYFVTSEDQDARTLGRPSACKVSAGGSGCLR